MTELFYRNKCMTDLSSCSTPNDKIIRLDNKAGWNVKLYTMYSFFFSLIGGGVYCKFYLGKAEKEKSSFPGVGCLTGGVYHKFYLGKSDLGISMFSMCTSISLYFLISWPFWMGSHWQYMYAKSSLFSLAVLNGREDIGQSMFICQNWAHCFKFCSCFTELFCFL